MSSQSFLLAIDKPSVKRYVFGTDPLNDVRWAGAQLDRLNREEIRDQTGGEVPTGCGVAPPMRPAGFGANDGSTCGTLRMVAPAAGNIGTEQAGLDMKSLEVRFKVEVPSIGV